MYAGPELEMAHLVESILDSLFVSENEDGTMNIPVTESLLYPELRQYPCPTPQELLSIQE